MNSATGLWFRLQSSLFRRMRRPDSAAVRPLPGCPMADHPHTVDRWDDATGENVIEQIAAVGDYLVYGRRCNAGLTPKSRSATGRGCSRTAILAGRKWTAA